MKYLWTSVPSVQLLCPLSPPLPCPPSSLPFISSNVSLSNWIIPWNNNEFAYEDKTGRLTNQRQISFAFLCLRNNTTRDGRKSGVKGEEKKAGRNSLASNDPAESIGRKYATPTILSGKLHVPGVQYASAEERSRGVSGPRRHIHPEAGFPWSNFAATDTLPRTWVPSYFVYLAIRSCRGPSGFVNGRHRRENARNFTRKIRFLFD